MLNSRQRAQLRGLANGIETIFQIGKAGVTENTVKQADTALEAREIIKLRALESSPDSPVDAARKIAEATGAQVVQVIGTRFILYRESKNNKQIKLVR